MDKAEARRAPARTAPWSRLLGPVVATAVVAFLAYVGASHDAHPFWPLGAAIPVLAALPLGQPASGRGVTSYLAVVVGAVCLTHAVFFGEDRYHVVATPALCILAACALRRTDERAATDL